MNKITDNVEKLIFIMKLGFRIKEEDTNKFSKKLTISRKMTCGKSLAHKYTGRLNFHLFAPSVGC